MLFKNETLVWVVLGAFLTFDPIITGAETTTAAIQTEGPAAWAKACTPPNGAMDQACFDKMKQAQIDINNATKDGDDCKKASEEFDKAKKAFKGACPPVGLPPDAVKCAEAVSKCSSKDDDDETSAKACPSKGADFTKLQDEAQKVEDSIATLNQKKGEFTSKEADLNDTTQKQIAEIEAKKTAAQAKFNAEQTKMRLETQKQLTDQQKQALASYQQQLTQYDQLTIQLKGIPVQEAQAQIQNGSQKLAQMQSDCYDQAIARVEKQQDKDRKLMEQGKWTCGGFNGCVKRMGLTDLQAYQQLAAQYQHNCIISEKFRILAAANQQVVQNIRQGLEVQKQGIIQQQSRLISSITSFQQQAATDQSQAYQSAALMAQSAQTSFGAEMQSLAAQEQTVNNSLQNKMAALKNQEQVLDQQIEVKKSYLEKKQVLLTAAEKASGGTDYSKEKAVKVEEGFANTDTAADTALNKCKCKSPTGDDQCSSFIAFKKFDSEFDETQYASRFQTHSPEEVADKPDPSPAAPSRMPSWVGGPTSYGTPGTQPNWPPSPVGTPGGAAQPEGDDPNHNGGL